MSYQSILSSLALCLSLVLSTTSAVAGIEIDPFEGVECIGGGEQAFCVQEIFGQYQVTNNALEPVYAFGVTNDGVSPTATSRSDWGSYSMNAEDWDTGISTAYFNEDWVELGSLGTYAALFGSDAAVNFYYNQADALQGNGLPITSGETDSGFFFGLDAASEVTAFGANGNVLFTTVSSVAAVPEPETYAMFLAGLALLGFAKRRQQS